MALICESLPASYPRHPHPTAAEALVPSLHAAPKGRGARRVEERALPLSVWPRVNGGHRVPRPALAVPQPAWAGLVRVI